MNEIIDDQLTWPEIEVRYYTARERLKANQGECQCAQSDYNEICNALAELFNDIWPGQTDR